MELETSRLKKMSSSLKITVLAGGPSRERPVSLVSGQAVARALELAGYQVRIADITPDNVSALDIPADVIFPVLHGVFGEDGQVQQLLEDRKLVYCGSGPQACRDAMNKNTTKVRSVELGIPTPAFHLVTSEKDIQASKACWSIPVVVKPTEEGSSFGVTIVKHADELETVIRDTLKQYGPTLVEEFIDGRELTVGVLGDKALPIIEIKPTHEFYDYEAKYNATDTAYVFVEDLPKEVYLRVQELSVKLTVGLGLRDFCRVDWRLDKDFNPYMLEVNAIPGFTDHSLLPKAADKAGVNMVELCQTIVQMALARSRAKSDIKPLQQCASGRLHGETKKSKRVAH
jgi:D-alanine-D-alanine ligase